MQVTSAAASGVSTPTTQTAAPRFGDYNSFLQLLVTELKHQDPTKPMDPTQTVSQLATLSSVEQAVKTNKLLSAMVANSSVSQAASLVGRIIAPLDGSPGGVVKSVTSLNDGLFAALADGRLLALSSGFTVS